MFVITCNLRWRSKTLGFGYASRQGAKHVLSEVEGTPSSERIYFLKPLRLSAFAGDTPKMGCSCSPTDEPLFPRPVWEKACTTVIESLLGVRKFSEDSPQRAQRTRSWRQREIDLSKNFRIPLSFLCELCVLRSECSEFFGCGSAALGPSCAPLKIPQPTGPEWWGDTATVRILKASPRNVLIRGPVPVPPGFRLKACRNDNDWCA